MPANTIANAIQSFSQFRQKKLNDLAQQELLEEKELLEKVETILNDIKGDLDKNVDLSNELDEILDLIEKYAEKMGVEVAQLEQEIAELYEEVDEFNQAHNNPNAPSPYAE